jgi:hypothetical protein
MFEAVKMAGAHSLTPALDWLDRLIDSGGLLLVVSIESDTISVSCL